MLPLISGYTNYESSSPARFIYHIQAHHDYHGIHTNVELSMSGDFVDLILDPCIGVSNATLSPSGNKVMVTQLHVRNPKHLTLNVNVS
jgi:hypothetical protein